MPTISGLAYCTAEALWSLSAPAVSLTKHAIQIAILAGFPIAARTAATIPQTTPASASFFFESDKFILFLLLFPILLLRVLRPHGWQSGSPPLC